jgi:hypothetical protein
MKAALGHRVFWVGMIATAVFVVLLANMHLLYVAFSSQPGCVPHLKERGQMSGQFRAAKSAC